MNKMISVLNLTRKKDLLLGFLCLFIYVRSNSQPKYVLPQSTPHSPNTASLEKYGEIPVTLQTGMPSVSIPLFNITAGSVQVPVSLSYHNNGLKVDEIPSWVGHGWDLMAGGSITFQQRGNYDFSLTGNGLFSGNSKNYLSDYLANQMQPLPKMHYLEHVIAGELDAEYDLYSYNFLGNSGSFYFDKDQNIISIPKNNLKIERLSNYAFSITDEQGTIYSFSTTETNLQFEDQNSPLFLKKDYAGITAYLLSSITTKENRVISFGYLGYHTYYYRTNYVYTYNPFVQFEGCPKRSLNSGTTNYQQDDNMLLQTISFPDGHIDFEHSSTVRQDIKKIDVNTNIPYLSRVKLYNNDNVLLKEYQLNHSYFGNNSRLRLDDIVLKGDNPQSWKFNYSNQNDSYPDLFTNAKDHWGYYNGAGGSTSIPRTHYKSFLPQFPSDVSAFMSSRRSNNIYGKYGILESISYPTGGKTLFEYEANEFTIPSYSAISTFNFLDYDELQGATKHDLVNESTTSTVDMVGSFTLTAQTQVNIIASRLKDPDSFIDSYILLSTVPNGTDIIQSQIGYTCAFGNCIAQGVATLPAGTYYYRLNRNLATWEYEDNPTTGYAGLQISYLTYDTPIPYEVGGCRVVSIKNNNGSGVVSTKRYVYDDNLANVQFTNIPEYISNNRTYATFIPQGGNSTCTDCGTIYKIHDESVKPMSGNSIDYKYVTELMGENGENGKIEYEFTTSENLQSESAFPYVQPIISTWRAGLIKTKKTYKVNNSSYALIQQQSNIYDYSYPFESVTKGLKVNYFNLCYSFSNLDLINPFDAVTTYAEVLGNYQTENFHKSNTLEIKYEEGGSISSVSSDSYLSTKHTLPTQTASPNSKGEMLKMQTSYSFDYAGNSYVNDAAIGLKLLKEKNVLVPVEQLGVQEMGGIDYVKSGQVIVYRSDAPLIQQVYVLNLVEPLLLSTFVKSKIDQSGNFIMDTHYQEKASIEVYDAFNNVLQSRYSSDLYQSNIWDYKSNYLIAEVKGAKSEDIAATSFEADGKGNFSFNGTISSTGGAITGHSCYNLSTVNPIAKTELSSGTNYIVSYWSNNGSYSLNSANTSRQGNTIGAWTYYEHEITGVSNLTISGTGLIDEVRLFPKNSLMTTYTYEPLIGLKSKCDIANNISYYEYDGLGRLKLIRDQHQNILQKMDYKYAD